MRSCQPPVAISISIREQKEAIRKVISLPYQWEGKQVRISASLGQASYPEHGASLSELLKYSDIALYEEKARVRTGGGLG